MSVQEPRRGVDAERALVGKKHCALHGDPGRAAVLGSKGGRRRSAPRVENLMTLEAPKSAEDLRKLFAHSILEVRTGDLDPRSANAIAYLGAGFLRALEASELEERLVMMEVQLEYAQQAISRLTKKNGRD